MQKKISLVTGASRGIGKAIVEKLLESGGVVCATARNIEGLNQLKAELPQYEERLHCFLADLSSSADVIDLCESVSKEVGDVDILVNNAGILHLETLGNSTEELLRGSFEVNVFAPFALTRYFSGAMIKKNQGTVINVCSSSSYTGGGAPEHCIYASTKHALLGFSRALDEELRSHNIRVGTVSPAGVSTDMMTGRGDLDHSSFMTSDEVADAVMYMINSDGQGIVYEMRMWRKSR
ncbi:SDR family oxidoreductase [Pseudomonadales bacterium]|nr:SDR family oxidoreductase [Pseudomonadales bacterium]